MSDMGMMMLAGALIGVAFLTLENPWPGVIRGLCALFATYLLIWANT